ncbi:putative effector protein [Ceratobasidium theobromae]|uniref:Hydrophobin n=1 Tax=Ceratobasidium theobromae TaxID=1582974 RepID=A0A5N5QNT1_9AGAM|nr:putative effector protein [Ceratobasidium theobromae]
MILRGIHAIYVLGLVVGTCGIPLEYQLAPAYLNRTLVTREWCPFENQYCCHRLYDRGRVKERAVLRDFLGLNIPLDDHLVGVRCSPIQELASGQQCESSIVCCTGGREYLGLVNTYCSPMKGDTPSED